MKIVKLIIVDTVLRSRYFKDTSASGLLFTLDEEYDNRGASRCMILGAKFKECEESYVDCLYVPS